MGLKRITRRSLTDRLKSFAIRVRRLPTIEPKDVSNLAYDTADELAYTDGYNSAIKQMRKIFEEEGFTI